MTDESERALDLLEHITQAIDRIQKYTKNGEDEFFNIEIIQDAVIRNLEIVGEASRSIEKRFPEFAEKHADLPLKSAYEMRSALSHGYFKIDLAVVWKTIQSDLPKLRDQIGEILNDSER